MLKHVDMQRFCELAADNKTLFPTYPGVELLDARKTDVQQHVRAAFGKPGDPEATFRYIFQPDQRPWTEPLAHFAQQGDGGALQPVRGFGWHRWKNFVSQLRSP